MLLGSQSSDMVVQHLSNRGTIEVSVRGDRIERQTGDEGSHTNRFLCGLRHTDTSKSLCKDLVEVCGHLPYDRLERGVRPRCCDDLHQNYRFSLLLGVRWNQLRNNVEQVLPRCITVHPCRRRMTSEALAHPISGLSYCRDDQRLVVGEVVAYRADIQTSCDSDLPERHRGQATFDNKLERCVGDEASALHGINLNRHRASLNSLA